MSDGSGRESALTLARTLLDDPEVRLVTFTAPAGVGKTWTAARLAYRMARARVVSVSLRRVEDLDGLLEHLAAAVELPAGEGTLGDRLADELGSEPTLLVLDECESLAGSPHPVSGLVADIPGLRVVATSLRPVKRIGHSPGGRCDYGPMVRLERLTRSRHGALHAPGDSIG